MKIERFAIDGGKELDAQLAALGTAIATKIGDDAVKASALVVQREWVRVAPYDPRHKLKTYTARNGDVSRTDYGHLRDQIKVQKVKARKETSVVYKVTTGNAFWAYFYEIGTIHQPPRPVFRPAAERVRGKVLDVQITAVRDGISKALSGGYGRVLPNGRNG